MVTGIRFCGAGSLRSHGPGIGPGSGRELRGDAAAGGAASSQNYFGVPWLGGRRARGLARGHTPRVWRDDTVR